MYELLLKWGLETLQKASLGKSDQELSVMLEAIRTKNRIVIERFKFSREAALRVNSLAMTVEQELATLRTELIASSESLSVNLLAADFHPPRYRELSKIRSEFDTTNDLLTAYSRKLSEILHIETIRKITKSADLSQGSEIARLYRGLWTTYASLLSSLVRVASADLRFWLVDEPYLAIAEAHAESDLRNLIDWLIDAEGFASRSHFTLSLETACGLRAFWEALQ